MTSISLPVHVEAHPNLRPLNVLRDLSVVADLIELCFSNTMDSEGQRYVSDMRRASRDDGFLRWATQMAETTSLPLTGYVWEENNKIVGNASLVPFRHKKQRIYLIANVAGHPDYRRRGTARALTERALLHARDKKAQALWLHVREDNPGAVKLYEELGFQERVRRTTWQANPDAFTTRPQTDKLRPEVTAEQIRKYSQKQVDVLNLKTGTLETIDFRSLNAAVNHPDIFYAVSVQDHDHLAAPLFKTQDLRGQELCLTFDNLLAKTPFVQLARTILSRVEAAYGRPVDIEFAWDRDTFYLLQCRSLSVRKEQQKVVIPADIPRNNVLFTTHTSLSNSIVPDLEYIVYVNPRIVENPEPGSLEADRRVLPAYFSDPDFWFSPDDLGSAPLIDERTAKVSNLTWTANAGYDLTTDLTGLNLHVLNLWGEDDPVRPVASPEIITALSNADIETVV